MVNRQPGDTAPEISEADVTRLLEKRHVKLPGITLDEFLRTLREFKPKDHYTGTSELVRDQDPFYQALYMHNQGFAEVGRSGKSTIYHLRDQAGYLYTIHRSATGFVFELGVPQEKLRLCPFVFIHLGVPESGDRFFATLAKVREELGGATSPQ